MWLLNKSRSKESSRKQIEIKEVKDGILILPHNQYRLIIETSSINFELKSEEEQDVLIDSFQNFLNSLPCPLQLLIRVREVDIDRYLEQTSQSKSTEKEKAKVKPETYAEKEHLRPFADEKAEELAFKLFDVYKKAHGMPSYT
jgi:hypothetical protein